MPPKKTWGRDTLMKMINNVENEDEDARDESKYITMSRILCFIGFIASSTYTLSVINCNSACIVVVIFNNKLNFCLHHI